ncbi:MAG TPA: penicillin acylase family protein, partial [Pseudonocardiaceae bacterium]|nr:penicillin acylase family protein [Pseudonocardiaceae bacterium]
AAVTNNAATNNAVAGDQCAGDCSDILPPGENGNATLVQILANKLLGVRPEHTDDQLSTYANLASDYSSVTDSTIDQYFHNSAFGVPPTDVESTIKPRSDVTITRDRETGVPHIYGTTRSGTEFGAGYAAGQDRLWLMDLFRHVGRGELSGFAGGSAGNRQLEQQFFSAAPYTEQDLQDQVNRIASSGPQGQQALSDVNAYLAGINTYITQAYNGRYFPGEYDLTGHIDPITNAGSIQPFTATDLIAIAGVIGAEFGSGGGEAVQSALVKQAAEAQYGVARGDQVWQSFREENDPEADLTVHDGQSFPYAASPADPQGVAMPDPGSVTPQQEVFDPTGSAASSAAAATAATPAPAVKSQVAEVKARSAVNLSPLVGMSNAGALPSSLAPGKHGMSNALVVSGRYTDDGHPIAVFGPQTGYFAPQLLMLEELQGPGISSRGAAFAGLSMYVELGRGPSYAWSATSAGQDVTDTFAISLCDPGGSATKDSNYYLDNGQCVPMQAVERDDSWSPTIADTTAAGSYKLIAYRTNYGLVIDRATINGKPVAYTNQRSSYLHEADSIIGFQRYNNPANMSTPQQFQQSASAINYTFNWFYVNGTDTAYFNSGSNPVRPTQVDPNLPIIGAPNYEWVGWNPAVNVSADTPFAAHPQSIDQDYYVSWNNKQALDYTTGGFGDGSVYRSNLLDERVKALVTSGDKVSRADVVKAMEDAALTDLRGEVVLPTILKVIDSQPVTDPTLAAAESELKTWLASGAKLTETSPGSHQYANAAAIQLLDAWWPLLVKAEFQPGLGDALFTALADVQSVDQSPSGVGHVGSAFQTGWWSYVDKDLRSTLGQPVSGALAVPYCGGLANCRQALLTSLGQAVALPASTVYPADSYCSAGDQWCADSIVQRPMGGVTDPQIGWQNRPTYQQVVQFG